MLRRVAFKNFLCFKDRQSLQFENGPNFLVGANGTGKTAIFELIRRCLSRSVNVTDSAVHDNKNNAFVISEFEIRDQLSDDVPAGYQLYSLYVRHLNEEDDEKYKLVCIHKGNDIKCYIDFGDDLEATVEEGLEKMHGALTKLIEVDDSDPHLKEINGMVKAAIKSKVEATKCERVLQDLNETVVLTFSSRSTGPLQWSHTKNIGKGDQHYRTTSKNAEIIQTLMRDEEKSGDVDEEGDVFRTITYPMEYIFQRDEKQKITVLNAERTIQLLKVPEGIIEAKQFSLMFTHKKYQTLLLEEPDRGMHPQMIQKLRDLVFRECETKKIVIVFTSHQPVMINLRAMSRLHVCRRNMNIVDKSLKYSILKMPVENIHKHQDQLKDMLYSAAVLFVEGPSDKAIIGWVFDRILGIDELKEFSLNEFMKLKAILTGSEIISMQGGKAHTQMKKWANDLSVPFAFLLDGDIVFKYTNNKSQLKKEIDNLLKITVSKSRIKQALGEILDDAEKSPTTSYEPTKHAKNNFDIEDRSGKEDIRDYLEKEENGQNAFIWDSKDLEVMICKSIRETLSTTPDDDFPELTADILKNMLGALKGDKSAIFEIDENTKNCLVNVLLRGKEMRTFLKFLWKQNWNLDKFSATLIHKY